ncbi:MAG: OmpA family protein [Opitutaceae bacterium]|nr:OmpA family protein [Opitutaceae bacterium]
MKLVSKYLPLVLAGAALLFAGCTKKPTRPTPSDTSPMGTGGRITDAGNLGGELPPGFENRTEGDWVGNQNRVALQSQTIYFDFDQSAIKPAEREKLKAAKDYLDKNPTHRLLLEGRCDWRGTAEYNLSLGDRRAISVKKYLVSIGVAATRIESISKGSLEAAKNADDATMATDRRVDLVVINSAGATPQPL